MYYGIKVDKNKEKTIDKLHIEGKTFKLPKSIEVDTESVNNMDPVKAVLLILCEALFDEIQEESEKKDD